MHEDVQSNERWVCLTAAIMEGCQLVIDYQAEWPGAVPNKTDVGHLRLYSGEW